MKIVKRLLIALAVLLLVIVAAAITIPILFKGKLLDLAKTEINKNVNAKVDFADVNLSLFRHFPDLGFRLEDFSVEGIEEFEGLNLARGAGLDLELDLGSLIGGGAVQVESITLSQPEINVLVLENGRANYDIAKPSTDTIAAPAETESSFRMRLNAYEITDGRIVYDDRSLGVYTEVAGLNHRGSGDLTLDVYDLETQTEINELTVIYDGISYLNKAQIDLNAILNIDQKQSKYTLKENQLRANELLLNFDGFTQLQNDDIILDFTFQTPRNEFKSLLSMVPNAYIEGYENVRADGQFALNGSVKGIYRAEPLSYPAFQVNMAVENGQVQYPNLPLGIADIFAKVNVNSPSSDFDDLTVDASDFRLKIGNNPFRAAFKLATPISDPAVDATVDGVIDLKELSKAFPLDDEIEDLSGIIAADVRVNTRMSVVESGAYDRVNMSGDMRLQNLVYDSKTYPTVVISDARADFTPSRVVLNQVEMNLGQSDLGAEGHIDNILAYFSPNKTMTGRLTVRSNYFNATEWVPETEAEPASMENNDAEPLGAPAAETEIFDRFQFDLDANIAKIDYEDYQLINTYARGTLAPNRLDISDAATQIGESDMRVNGNITNMFDYVFSDGTLGGAINLVSNRLNLNEFMPESEAPASENGAPAGEEIAMAPIPVPANIDMLVNTRINEIIYTNMTINGLDGQLLIEDQQVIIEDAAANILGGQMAFSGGYDTRDIEKPAFEFKYDLQSMDFQRSFNTFNTFQALAPVGKFIEGKFNSSLIMNGVLGQDMMPVLSSLNAQGFLETINGVVQGLKPLQAIGEKLNIQELRQEMELIGTRNWFEVQDGKLTVQPFDIKIKDIKMTISGEHSITLTGGMDYNIQAEIPREMLEKSSIGAAANTGLDLLSQEAGKLGINLAQSEIINVGINLTGSLTDPKTNIKLLGTDGKVSVADAVEQKAQEEIGAAKEQLREEAEQKVEEGKEIASEAAREIVDSAKTVAGEKLGAVKEEVEQKAGELLKDKAGGVLDSTAQKGLEELIGKKDSSAVDDIKNKLEKFNPFKKKKKKSGGGQ